jgi:hypothetical protein
MNNYYTQLIKGKIEINAPNSRRNISLYVVRRIDLWRWIQFCI